MHTCGFHMWLSENANVSIELRVILVQWPCNCVPTVGCYQKTFTERNSKGGMMSPGEGHSGNSVLTVGLAWMSGDFEKKEPG